MLDVAAALRRVSTLLTPLTDTPSLDAQVLLAHLLKKPRPWLLAYPETVLTSDQEELLDQSLNRLQSGEPLPYLLGHQEFYGLDFNLSPAVLIPRSETELLVEQALDWLQKHPSYRLAADIGTGSGCIAISLAVYIPNLRVIASDLSFASLQVARLNARMYNVEQRLSFVQSDLITPYEKFNLIAANLPYIPSAILSSLPVSHHEPLMALNGGTDGLLLIRRLLQQSHKRLAPGGLLLIEIESSHGSTALFLARETFPHAQISLLPDLAGLDRLLRIEVGFGAGYENPK